MALTGIKLRAFPTEEQKHSFSQWMGCARFIYNAKCDDDKYFRTFLAHNLGLTGHNVPVDQTYSQYKSELSAWLSDCPSQILRNSAVNWYQAYQRFFQGLGGRPKRKRKGGKDSIWLTSELFRFEDGKLFIGSQTNNIGYLSFEAHRDFSLPKSITISRKNGEWFVSFCYEDGRAERDPIEIIDELKKQGEAALLFLTTGLDRGVVIPMQASSGQSFDFTQEQKAGISSKQKRIKRQQRRLSRQHKGSKRREQTKLKISKAHNDIVNIRKDFAHKTSRTLVSTDAEIFIAEDLKVQNMTRRPKAKQDDEGKYLPNRARAKAALNGAILASAWGIMILFLAYKAARQNKVVIKIAPQESSQECAACGHTHPDNRQTQDKFVCLECGHTENADLNAAKVLRNRGVKKIVSVKSQEWEVKRDQTLRLITDTTRGTRGSARRGRDKTLAAKASKAVPKSRVRSELSANLVRAIESTVVMTDRPSQEAPRL
jgi:putative transposase